MPLDDLMSDPLSQHLRKKAAGTMPFDVMLCYHKLYNDLSYFTHSNRGTLAEREG